MSISTHLVAYPEGAILERLERCQGADGTKWQLCRSNRERMRFIMHRLRTPNEIL